MIGIDVGCSVIPKLLALECQIDVRIFQIRPPDIENVPTKMWNKFPCQTTFTTMRVMSQSLYSLQEMRFPVLV